MVGWGVEEGGGGEWRLGASVSALSFTFSHPSPLFLSLLTSASSSVPFFLL